MTHPEREVSIKVTFKKAPVTPATFVVNVRTATNGTVTVSKEEAVEGDSISITATANSGFEVEKITVLDAQSKEITVSNNKFTMPASDVTVTFKAIVVPEVSQTYTISFDGNGGSVTPSSSKTGTDGTLSSLPTASRSGYSFKGWYTSSTEGSKISTSTVFERNTTVYAQWTFDEVKDPEPTPEPDDSGNSGNTGNTGNTGGNTTTTHLQAHQHLPPQAQIPLQVQKVAQQLQKTLKAQETTPPVMRL